MTPSWHWNAPFATPEAKKFLGGTHYALSDFFAETRFDPCYCNLSIILTCDTLLLKYKTIKRQESGKFIAGPYPLPMYVNILTFSFRGDMKQHLRLLARTADSIADGDHVEKRIRSGQNWSLLPMQVYKGWGVPWGIENHRKLGK